jgi:hypothetical protein
MYSMTPNAYVTVVQRVPCQTAPTLSLSDSIAADIGSIAGVSEVSAQRRGDYFSVDVMLNRFEFDVRRKVYLKEQELYDAFPEYDFDFRVMPDSAAESDAVRA